MQTLTIQTNNKYQFMVSEALDKPGQLIHGIHGIHGVR